MIVLLRQPLQRSSTISLLGSERAHCIGLRLAARPEQIPDLPAGQPQLTGQRRRDRPSEGGGAGIGGNETDQSLGDQRGQAPFFSLRGATCPEKQGFDPVSFEDFRRQRRERRVVDDQEVRLVAIERARVPADANRRGLFP